MSVKKIEAWIESMGQTYEDLLEKSLLPDEDFIELFPGIDELYLEPIAGISLKFQADTERLDAVFINLIKQIPEQVLYEGELPIPYSAKMNHADVRALFGEPFEASGPIDLPLPVGSTGGWESYRIGSRIYMNIKVVFKYSVSMDVTGIVFTLIDKG